MFIYQRVGHETGLGTAEPFGFINLVSKWIPQKSHGGDTMFSIMGQIGFPSSQMGLEMTNSHELSDLVNMNEGDFASIICSSII